jgi:hypothetical protein
MRILNALLHRHGEQQQASGINHQPLFSDTSQVQNAASAVCGRLVGSVTKLLETAIGQQS